MNDKFTDANDFHNEQIDEYNEWNEQNPNDKKPVHADTPIGGITFSHNPTGDQKSFRDATWIKTFNGATRHFYVWRNTGEYKDNPKWGINPLNHEGRNYVELVCNQQP